MATPDRDFDRLVAAGRELITGSIVVSLQHWAAVAGVSTDVVKATYLTDATRRAALEQAIGARCVDAEGGCFLIASRGSTA